MVTLIMGVLCSGLFLTLTVGDFSSSVSQAKADLQAKVRLIMDAIIRDVRQTSRSQINDITNAPGANHIKFKVVSGTNEADGNLTFSTDYIEYTYDPNLLQLTRSSVDGAGAPRIRVFHDITDTTFFSEEGVPFVVGANSGKLIVNITAQSQAREARNLLLSYSLTEEVKIRNE